MENEQKRDEVLWQVANRRATFKRSFITYLVVNAFLIGVWYFTSGPNSYFWPIWPILGWGIGILMQYINAYHGNKGFTAEQEYERLKHKQEKL